MCIRDSLYPEIKARAAQLTEPHEDMVRYEIMKRFGYYVTESSQHTAEYTPYSVSYTHLDVYKRQGQVQDHVADAPAAVFHHLQPVLGAQQILRAFKSIQNGVGVGQVN